MKKTNQIILTAVLYVAISSCHDESNEWIDGAQNGKYRDTSLNNHPYRYYGGGWYPIYNNRINPTQYIPAAGYEIARPGFTPGIHAEGVHTGGFGSTAGEGGGGE